MRYSIGDTTHWFEVFTNVLPIKFWGFWNKNNVSSKYRLEVSQLSLQRFTGFWLILSKKLKHLFSENYLRDLEKWIFLQKFIFVLQNAHASFCQNLVGFQNISQEETDFPTKNVQKRRFIAHSKVKNCFLQKFDGLIIHVMSNFQLILK